MVRVLHVVNSMNKGGLETFIMNIYRKIDREKIQFDFLVHDTEEGSYDNEILSLGGRIHYVSSRNKGILKNKRALKNFFKNNNEYKIIHQHASSLSYIEPLYYAKKYKLPVRIIQSHSTQEGGMFLHKYIHKINKSFIANIATDYWACSDLSIKWMYSKSMINNNKCKFIPNGIEMDKFMYSKEKRENIRNIFNIRENFIIGHIGRFSYPKNHEFILDIFKEIKKKESKAHLILVGDGELKESIEQKINYLGLKNSVTLTGLRSDIEDLVQCMDVLLFPSHYEGLPITLIEAQASGLKCIVSDKITKQVQITDNISYLDLEKGANYWADFILKHRNYNRQNYINSNISPKFNIENTVGILEKFYLEKDKEYEF